MKHPFPVPWRLTPSLRRVHGYWRGLLRGAAATPFADDVQLIDLADTADALFLIDVFNRPERFRFATVGKALGDGALEGLFLDETDLAWPFAYLRSQCSATIEAEAPTHHAFSPAAKAPGAPAYRRLLLPLWGGGRFNMLLGAVEVA